MRRLCLALLVAFATAPALAKTTGDAVDSRRAEIIAREQAKPFPKLEADPQSSNYVLARLNLALADFERAPTPPDAVAANSLLKDALAAIPDQQSFKSAATGQSFVREEGFHFELAQYLFRIDRMFGPAGTQTAHLLTKYNQQRMAALFYAWARAQCAVAVPRAMQVWNIWGSENHDAQRASACWAAAVLLSGLPDYANRPYADGSLPKDQANAWSAYLRHGLSERALHGTLMEYFSPTYSQYTLNTFYLYADFSPDPELKRLAAQSLDLWWALWSQEQLGGVHGGSETRRYAAVLANGTPMSATAWLYFGLGAKPAGLAPGEAGAFASSYRPPSVLADIARGDRGTYDVWTRAPGLSQQSLALPGSSIAGLEDGDAAAWTSIDSRQNGILRVTHVTSDYVMGTAMTALLPPPAWAPFSEQNRWDGLIFADGDANARIAPTLVSPTGRKVYDGLFGVQQGGLQMVRSMLGAGDKSGGRLQVWFGAPVKSADAQGWVFVDGPAFVAVRPAQGGWRWTPQGGGRWLVPDDPRTAIIIQAAARRDYADINAFMAAVGKMHIVTVPQLVSVTGLGAAGTLSLGLGSNGTLAIDGKAVDFNPLYIFKSPFVNAPVGSPVIRIEKGGQSLSLDFHARA